MNLHRTGKSPEWATVPHEERNIWQKTAAKTHSVVTPANAVSLIGLGIVGSGLKDIADGNTGRGIAKIGGGRLLDVVDGMVAHRTKTKSPTGEAVDVVVDKIEAAAALPILTLKGILPPAVAGSFLAQHLANTLATAAAKRRGNEIHPSKEGKWNTAGQWGAISLYGLSAAARNAELNGTARRLELAGHLTTVVTTYLGASALVGYIKDAQGLNSESVQPQTNQPETLQQVVIK
ncbi:MAG: hypothetical protein M3Q79_04430 [bacterium]|nr:hypothetical protein [bacterium]